MIIIHNFSRTPKSWRSIKIGTAINLFSDLKNDREPESGIVISKINIIGLLGRQKKITGSKEGKTKLFTFKRGKQNLNGQK
jgi:hypothetical protein